MAVRDEEPWEDVGTLPDLVAPHVESFDYFVNEGLKRSIAALEPQEASHLCMPPIRVWFDSITIGRPVTNEPGSLDTRLLFPSEARQRGSSYRGQMHATVCWQVGEGEPERVTRNLGLLPIMVRSRRCHLHGLSRAQLVQRGEESNEAGGYFVCNGNERAIRLLIAPKRDHLMGIVRTSFRNRGSDFTQYAVSIRSVRRDGSSQTVALHLLATGGAKLRVTISKQEFFVPIVTILKALVHCSDHLIYTRAIGGDYANSHISDRLVATLREHAGLSKLFHSRCHCLSLLGSRFRPVMRVSSRLSDKEVGELFLKRYVFVHIASTGLQAKWELAILMMQKMYALASGRINEDNPDSLVNQEVLLPGHLFGMIVKENLTSFLNILVSMLEHEPKAAEGISASAYEHDRRFRTCLDRASSKLDIGRKLHYFLATGNLVSESGLDLQQTSGFTIVAERLNFWRFISHFRSIHRGAFFAQLRTTTVRKLLPDSWGFLCPVHTPDGSPCGLLNHLSAGCYISQTSADHIDMISLLSPCLVAAGAILLPLGGALPVSQYVPLVLDSHLLGRVHLDSTSSVAAAIRQFKVLRGGAGVEHLDVVLSTLEIVPILPNSDGRFPGIYLYSGAARLLRPVYNLKLQATEQLGPMEQTTLRIACTPQNFKNGEFTHSEVSATSLFSVVASLTPFCDFNQSPRNMYQCQMGKQTMGTPYHSLPRRLDTKAYRLQTPQSPIVRNDAYNIFHLDEYATGTNAVVAVISYTGYDMEDAMIINKGSFDRGFGHASLYTTTIVDLSELRRTGEPPCHSFGNRGEGVNDAGDTVLFEPQLGPDGLPEVGSKVKKGDPLCTIIDESTGRHIVKRHTSSEPAIVEDVRLFGDSSGATCERASIKLRFNRNPIAGDKFSSRHGQKGVMSRLWSTEDMPFSESGLTPDILFNPHGFPSRMTIGMLLESMAGKAGSLNAVSQDGTPFRFSERLRAVDFFGEQLRAAGYAYHGMESMHSGTFGIEMQVKIFVGVVYYQRLRHMVSDKDQVRAKGPINQLTHQPIHGRKVHGGIRLGEMERDSLLAHGTSFMVQERLLHCSDEARAFVCTQCGCLVGPMMFPSHSTLQAQHRNLHCRVCACATEVDVVTVPYVFQYLTNELAAMNIKTQLQISERK